MLKYASKFFFEKILPSVVATVAGAYIVNHYVVSKPADAPLAAAVSHAPIRPASNNPESGVRAKGISEKAIAKVPAEKSSPRRLLKSLPRSRLKPQVCRPKRKSINRRRAKNQSPR